MAAALYSLPGRRSAGVPLAVAVTIDVLAAAIIAVMAKRLNLTAISLVVFDVFGENENEPAMP
ncbi:hypothetical protein [Nocardia aurea]|uniref:hypothetical protein n=1 Tax=Nocardia aurea TaxID=2144174 RepID=UPI0033BF5134